MTYYWQPLVEHSAEKFDWYKKFNRGSENSHIKFTQIRDNKFMPVNCYAVHACVRRCTQHNAQLLVIAADGIEHLLGGESKNSYDRGN